MGKLFSLFAGIIFCLHLTGCARTNSYESDPIVVASAANLQMVGTPLAERFEKEHKAKITFSFGSSGQLEQAIRQGAPYDVYIPAELSYCEALQRDGLLEGDGKIFALGKLVAWSPSLTLQSLAELSDPKIHRISLANPRYAPYGLAAQQALQAAGLWRQLQPKLVYANNVSHAYQMARTGNTEVALVALALIHDAGGNFLLVDPGLFHPIRQCAAVLRHSPKKELANAFVAFLTGSAAQVILEQHGYARP